MDAKVFWLKQRDYLRRSSKGDKTLTKCVAPSNLFVIWRNISEKKCSEVDQVRVNNEVTRGIGGNILGAPSTTTNGPLYQYGSLLIQKMLSNATTGVASACSPREMTTNS